MPLKTTSKRIESTLHSIGSENPSLGINNANMRRLVTHIEPCKNPHRSLSFVEALMRLRSTSESGKNNYVVSNFSATLIRTSPPPNQSTSNQIHSRGIRPLDRAQGFP